MKKIIQMLCILVLFAVFGYFLYSAQNRNVQFGFDKNNTLVLSLKTNDSEEVLYPWFDENTGLTYFFLPSFAKGSQIYCDYVSKGTISIDGEELSRWESFEWETKTPYLISYGGQEQEVVFMKSANLPSLFLETESGSMEYLNADKVNEEAGVVNLVKASGSVEYQGGLKKVSARGNSTFAAEKKSYTFTLDKAHPLCGLDSGKKWNLLAMYYEDNKMQSKLIYDMADYLGMEYTPGSTWVDLYCNGNYQGLYLLTEAITVGDGRVEISGGYLLERDVTESLEEKEVYFSTDICNYNFVISSPKIPTQEEYDYIRDFVQNIENMLVSGDANYKNYLDLDSFAKQFLIDKLVLNPDAMRSSTFYYKDSNSDVLKAGPLWDYDRAMGVSMPNYTTAVGDYPDTMNEWYMPLYADEEFKNKLLSYYEELIPYLEEMLETKIDAYARMLGPSVAMDVTLWPMDAVYKEHESYVKYLKYFLANRIYFLNETWGLSDFDFETVLSSEEMHEVSFLAEDGTLLEADLIRDGECIASLPESCQEDYEWRYNLVGKSYDPDYPVFEDMELYAKRRGDDSEEYSDYRFEKLKRENSLLNYLTLLKDTDLSVCIYIPAGSEVLSSEEALLEIEGICNYQLPEKLRTAAVTGEDYFLLVDNGWESIWESINGEALNELNTTFGPVSYYSAEDGRRHLFVQDTETNYMESFSEKAAIQFIVINRLTGEIEDVAAFTIDERSESK